MRIDVAFTPVEAAPAPIGVVVDVLRATSTIAQALASGYRRVLCCVEIEDALALRGQIPDSLVGGERKAVQVEGFDVGASPREFLEPRARPWCVAPAGVADGELPNAATHGGARPPAIDLAEPDDLLAVGRPIDDPGTRPRGGRDPGAGPRLRLGLVAGRRSGNRDPAF